jgi:hypothetical protein
MMTRIFPRAIDNLYRGQWIGLGLFVLFVLVKLLQSVNSILNPRDIMIGADAIPLDTYGVDAAQMAILLFVLLAWSQLVLALTALIALVRYRAMIPLLFLIFLVEHLGRRALIMFNPTERAEGVSVGLYVNVALAIVLLLGFLLSIWTRRAHRQRAEA